jgi:hypothetical protein
MRSQIKDSGLADILGMFIQYQIVHDDSTIMKMFGNKELHVPDGCDPSWWKS